ncbi:Om45p SCDLUD_002822 [Saccharomycodes ludwigii]|uniref:Om45p n=1 Tax=Saccharomycodes ludwigii TaxID=36035 RepID=UPI001E83C622|nr:hypothetical protein SCDLUD_002822 [Saccharomycodes ludwigii]KAH3901331.1 hypothetical protein SCDLUD_002822 [Saccharomycodes ludwigii]
MSTKFLLGTAAVVATTYVYYEKQNQEQKRKDSLIYTGDGTRNGLSDVGINNNTTANRYNHYQQQAKSAINDLPTSTGSVQTSCLSNIKQGIKEDAISLKNAIVGGNNGVVSNAEDLAAELQHTARSTYYDGKASVENKTHTIFDSGVNKYEAARAKLINEVDSTTKKYNELKESLKTTTEEQRANIQSQIDESKSKLLDLQKRLKESASDYHAKINPNVKKLSDSIYENTLGHIDATDKPQNEENSVKTTAKSIRGWGDTAEILGQDTVDDWKLNNSAGKSKAQEELDRLKDVKRKGWYSYDNDGNLVAATKKSLEGWGETAAEFSREQYEEAQAGLKKLNGDASDSLEKVNENAKHWWQWGTSKGKEGLNKVNDGAVNTTSQVIDSTGQGLDYLNDKAQSGLSDANDFVEKQKKN